MECGENRKLDEHYNHFSIDIGEESSLDVTKSLSTYFKPADKLRSTCEKCTHEYAQHNLRCTKWPSVLLLQLKRFRYNLNGESNKDQCSVFIPHHLHPKNDTATGSSPHYRLTGVIEHTGHKSSSGHYTANIYHDAKWHRCNDSVVTEINDNPDYIQTSNGINSNKAYVLMFEMKK